MKKILLAGAAVVALASSPAFAQEEQGVKLDLGGHFKGYVGYVDQDEVTGATDVRDFDILRNTEVHFTGETTLDNGLTVGAHIEATADQGDSFDIEESYAYFSGSWGRVNFGAEDGAAYLMQVAAPSADPNYDGLRQYISPVNYDLLEATQGVTYGFGGSNGLDYDQDFSGYSDKITYLSPVFSGFQFGVSYTPETDTESRDFGNSIDDQTGDQSDVFDLAVRYEGQFDGWGTALGAGYTIANEEDDTASSDDREQWNVGADFDIGAFGVGAAYTDDNGGLDDDGDIENIVVGADYTTGPFVIGASYLYQQDEGGAANSELETDRYTGGVTYNYGPGMTFRGTVSYLDYSSDIATQDSDATVVLLGTQINF